jgi:hypothetical protein
MIQSKFSLLFDQLEKKKKTKKERKKVELAMFKNSI